MDLLGRTIKIYADFQNRDIIELYLDVPQLVMREDLTKSIKLLAQLLIFAFAFNLVKNANAHTVGVCRSVVHF